MNVRLSALTDVGVIRDHNEDDFLVVQSVAPYQAWNYDLSEFENPENGLLLLVADGMGGTNAGEIASAIMVKTMEEELTQLSSIPQTAKKREKILLDAIHKTKKQIVDQAKNNPQYQGMGTTAVIAWVLGNQCHLAWIGDSRAYRLSKNKALEIISRDHSLVWDLMRKGMLTEEEAETHPDSNIITQSLSDSTAKIKPESKTIDLLEGDKLLLCSDGLNGMVPKGEIADILIYQEADKACKLLVEEANKYGGTDNITVVLLEMAPFHTQVMSEEEKEEKHGRITQKINQETLTPPAENKTSEIPETPDVEEKAPIEKSKPGFFKRIWQQLTTEEIVEEETVEEEREEENSIETQETEKTNAIEDAQETEISEDPEDSEDLEETKATEEENKPIDSPHTPTEETTKPTKKPKE
ncbi:MAG: hypothetical protein B7C24_06665 [Bacteroidetes bacterium 4572_77]|nr:MAG: hypothetical protein B7C24_06665 [Bacteroidetes bacterium 4572_77]